LQTPPRTTGGLGRLLRITRPLRLLASYDGGDDYLPVTTSRREAAGNTKVTVVEKVVGARESALPPPPPVFIDSYTAQLALVAGLSSLFFAWLLLKDTALTP
jgi:hypothetical protein